MHKAEQNGIFASGLAPTATRTAAEAAGAAVDMAKVNNVVFLILQAGATQYQGDVTYVIAEGTNSTQYSDTFLATVTLASATTDQCDSVELAAEKLSAGYRYVRIEATPAAGTANAISVCNVSFNPRYADPN